MKRIGLITLGAAVALSNFSAAEDVPTPIVQRPHHIAPAANSAPRVVTPQAPRTIGNTPRQFSTHPQQQFRPNTTTIGGGINRSPRIPARDLTPKPRIQPTVPAPVTSTTPEQQPVLRSGSNDRNAGRDWRNRGSNAANEWRNRGANAAQGWRNHNGGDNQPSDRQASRDRNHDGNHHEWHHDWDRNHHDRGWWRNHYTRFALFGGGYYFWDAGFWYPAYGYDPLYSTYAYEAPIYGYNSLPPGEVMAAVQEELARQGYYDGAIDGTYGPLTREALVRYQEAFGLEATGLLDQPTLESLGID